MSRRSPGPVTDVPFLAYPAIPVEKLHQVDMTPFPALLPTFLPFSPSILQMYEYAGLQI